MGNHDQAASSLVGLERFTPAAATAARWAHRRLTADNRRVRESRPCPSGDIRKARKSAPRSGARAARGTKATRETTTWELEEYIEDY